MLMYCLVFLFYESHVAGTVMLNLADFLIFCLYKLACFPHFLCFFAKMVLEKGNLNFEKQLVGVSVACKF